MTLWFYYVPDPGPNRTRIPIAVMLSGDGPTRTLLVPHTMTDEALGGAGRARFVRLLQERIAMISHDRIVGLGPYCIVEEDDNDQLHVPTT